MCAGPTITSLVPGTITAYRTATIALMGRNFTSSGVTCRVNGVLGTATFVSSEQINCQLPGLPIDPSYIIAMSNFGQIYFNASSSLAAVGPTAFTYSPTTFFYLAGGTITVQSANIFPGLSCALNGTLLGTTVTASTTMLTCTLPSYAAPALYILSLQGPGVDIAAGAAVHVVGTCAPEVVCRCSH